MLTARILAAFIMASLSIAACAADAEDDAAQPEEQGSTESQMTTSPGAQVVAYARKNDCDISGNHIVELDCPIATDKKVFAYAQEKLGKKKAYRCGGTAYAICLNY